MLAIYFNQFQEDTTTTNNKTTKKKKKQLRKERQEQDGRESNEKSREVSPENMSSDEQQKEKKEQDTTTTIQMSNKKKKLLMRRERKLRQFKHEMSLINVDQKDLERRKQQIEEQREAQRKQKQKREEWKNGKLSVEIVDQIKKRIRIIEFLDLQARHIQYEKFKSEKIKKGLLLESAKKEQLHKTSEEKGEYASFFYETTKEEWGGEEEQMGYCVAGKSGVRIFCLLQLLCFFILVANYCAISSITSKVSLILC